jgi:hypothetical protein
MAGKELSGQSRLAHLAGPQDGHHRMALQQSLDGPEMTGTLDHSGHFTLKSYRLPLVFQG